MIIISNTDHQLFFNQLTQKFSQNLSEKIIINLAQILVIDYSTRLKDSVNNVEHLNTITNKLQNFLREKIIHNDDFSTVMTLFTIAISPEYFNDRSLKNLNIEQTENIEAAVDFIIVNHFSEYGQADLKEIRANLVQILKTLGIGEVFKFIKSNRKTFKLAIVNIIQQNVTPDNLKKSQHNIYNFINRKNILAIKIDRFKQNTTKFGLIFGSLSITALTIFSGGIIAPILSIPALLIALKTAPKFGVLVGKAMIKVDYSVRSETKKLNSIKSKLFASNLTTESLSKQGLYKDNTKIETEISNAKVKNLSHLKDTLSLHFNKEYSNQKNDSDLQHLPKRTNKDRIR